MRERQRSPEKAEKTAKAIRGEYEAHGVEEFYASAGRRYRNPHEPIIRELLERAVEHWRPDLTEVLDLACGSGEVTLTLRGCGAGRIVGVDPFTGAAYLERTGARAETYRFEEIAAGALAGRRFSLIVCSFALHLLDESWLPRLLFELARVSGAGGGLLILTPHKRPELRPAWGWQLSGELQHERVRARLYRTGS